ncbi:polysaccharide pyruvyl transferase family protein [Ruminococcus flavefaciens]|uniref:polysaccharide pyruvyl transferase family protein n=1 Tax=Ruminococcus flavefaciens TaxID=1265 RepID=UPI00048A834A|nr:polysaccharide pyruvyl transferase family protein [Ruminococcus flavefaciens]
MKCVIVTFHNVYNFGAVLQAYSLKSYIEHKGHSVVFADLRTKELKDPYSLNPFQKPLGIKILCKRTLMILAARLPQALAFKNFANKRMGTTIKGDRKAFEEYSPDAVIIGSDQVWNDALTGETDVYYLPWLDKSIKKIAYAASLGKKKLTEYQKKCIKENLEGFYRISLRENSCINEIKQLSDKETSVVLDPVFLNDKQFWSELAGGSRVRPQAGSYILIYALNFSSDAVKKAECISEEMKLPVIIVHPTGTKQAIKGKQLYNVGPCEYLYLIKNSALVITDSFHGTAFSLLFEKKIYCAGDITDSRVGTLLGRIRLNDDSITNICGVQVFDFSKSDNTALKLNINESKSFLDSTLE